MLLYIVFISFFIPSLNSINASEENMHFDVVYNSKIIGNLTATRSTKNSKTYYQSATNIQTRIITTVHVFYTYDVIFNNGSLEKSSVQITVNDKPHTETLTQWVKTKYQIVETNRSKKILEDSIPYSSIMLYFKEPVNISKCYSEQNGNFNDIISKGNHAYKKVNSKGNENVYYYQKGALKRALIDGGLVKFEIIATKEH